jgi:hypothetical protein
MEVQAALAAAATERAANLASVEEFLSSPIAERAAGLAGADALELRARVAALGDQELRDIAERARALEADPAAGASTGVTILAVLGVIFLILVVVYAAECSGDAWC